MDLLVEWQPVDFVGKYPTGFKATTNTTSCDESHIGDTTWYKLGVNGTVDLFVLADFNDSITTNGFDGMVKLETGAVGKMVLYVPWVLRWLNHQHPSCLLKTDLDIFGEVYLDMVSDEIDIGLKGVLEVFHHHYAVDLKMDL